MLIILHVVRVHTLRTLDVEDSNFNQSRLAYAEMILLSITNTLVTSASSTFGYMAQSWGNVLPSLILDFEELSTRSTSMFNSTIGDTTTTGTQIGDKRNALCKLPIRFTHPCAHSLVVPSCLRRGKGQLLEREMVYLNSSSSSCLTSSHKQWLTMHQVTFAKIAP